MLIFQQPEELRQQAFEAAIARARNLLILRGAVRSWTLQRSQILIEAAIRDRMDRGERDTWKLARYAIFAACAELNLTTRLRAPVDARGQPPHLKVASNRNLPDGVR